MIYIRSAEPSSIKESVEPTLRLQLTVVTVEPGAFTGMRLTLRAGDGAILGGEVEARFGGSPVTFPVTRSREPWVNRESYVQADFRLTRREIERIEQCRVTAPRHDVVLTLEGKSTRFVAQYAVTETENYNVTFQGNREQETVLVHRKPNRGTGAIGPQLVSPDSGGGLFQLVFEDVPKAQVTIPSSTWIADFSVPFGVGKFLVLDLPQPEDGPPGSGDLPERVREASAALEKMRTDVQKGEWTQCAEDARPVMELLNKPDLIRPLLETNGIQTPTADALLDGLRRVLEYSHAFHHRIDKDQKTVVPAVNAEPEDAYLAFATAAALLNLIGKKLQKSRKAP